MKVSTFRLSLFVLCCLALSGMPMGQANASDRPANATSGANPDVVAYILRNGDFEVPLPEEERLERLSTNLPDPAIREALPATATRFRMPIKLSLDLFEEQAQWEEGWATLYLDDYETSFPVIQRDECEMQVMSNNSSYQWGQATLPAGGGSGQWGIWPAAGGAIGLDPAINTYPEQLITQIICFFPELDDAHNVMTQFDIWQDAADIGDTFFVGFHNGETSASGEPLFYGYEWTQTRYDSLLDDHTWETRRIYFPDAAVMVANGQDPFAVMWQFQSDANRHEDARGMWLDNVSVERYQEPDASKGCEALDPQAILLGAPEEGRVSKGLNLPPYLEDDLAGRIERMVVSDVHWARLELAIQPDALIDGYEDGELVIRSLDLKYFDDIVDRLCAEQIAVLGLLDYLTLASQDWQISHSADASYIAEFTEITNLLVGYYGDRIGAWEVWNEPDYTGSRLTPASYVDLLVATYDEIKDLDGGDQVVFGGLGSADTNAADYLYEFYDELGNAYPGRGGPYDIFALHPYMSTLYRDASQNLLVDPQDYLHYESPTIIAKFQDIISGNNPHGIDDGQVEIWATELGWNSAKGAETCSAIVDQLVTREEQAQYMDDGYDILLSETTWDDGSPGVTKVFWYQYRDTGVILDCADTSSVRHSPSWYASHPQQTDVIAAGLRPAHWWFGLYDGAFVPKPSQLAFRDYTARPPTVTIAIEGEDIVLTWAHAPQNASYEIWRSQTPYFAPEDPTSIRIGTIEPETGEDTIVVRDEFANNAAAPDYFYVIRADNAKSLADAKPVGKVAFDVVPAE